MVFKYRDNMLVNLLINSKNQNLNKLKDKMGWGINGNYVGNYIYYNL